MTEIDELSARLGEACGRAGLMVATAESCTGGGVAEAITRTAGSSAWFDRGFVAYADAAKVD
ncbi:MAG TPA: CinA family protein, partial [Usitatibacteraceae bacterium]|nr:CinA family protein [Usitatibacteraceae bacterium]